MKAIGTWLLLTLAGLVASAHAETHTVTITGMTFQPASLSVRRGDTVVWRNEDLVPHTATAQGVFDSGSMAPGASKSWTAGVAGKHAYICTYHPSMKAVVEVWP